MKCWQRLWNIDEYEEDVEKLISVIKKDRTEISKPITVDQNIYQDTFKEIEDTVKGRNIFGLERKVSVIKSGNSLVIRIPPEINWKLR